MTPSLPDCPCCLVLPYHATIYPDGYGVQEPYLTDSGRVYVELTTNQVALLEQGGQQAKTLRAVVKQRAQKHLAHDLIRSIERHEGIGDAAGWLLPLTTRNYMFVMFNAVNVVLRGTPVAWKKRKGGIFFAAKVQFCVTADL